MTLPRTAADVLSGHVTLEIESIDRMYLNLYVPPLQRALGVVGFFKHHRGLPFASGALMGPMTDAWLAAIYRDADRYGWDVIRFEPGQRKDDIAQRYLANFAAEEGILFIGVAQERPGCGAPRNGATRRPGPPSRGWYGASGYPITSTSTAWTATSAHS